MGDDDGDKEPGDMGMLELLQPIEGVSIGGETNTDTPVVPPPVVASNKSVVWLHFDPVTLPFGIKKNKCRHCNKLMSVQKKKTTTHLMKHLKEACPMRHKIFSKPLNQAAAFGDASNQTQLTGVVLSKGENSVHTFVFSFDRVKILAAHMVLAHEYPFIIVEHKVFNEFLRAYTPYYKKISRWMVRKEFFSVFDRERERLKGLLDKVSRVSLTTDFWWSGDQKIGYMVITGHFVDKNWTLQKRVLSFVNVPPPHNGPAFAKEVHRVCNIYGINDKVYSITVDNAIANDVCIAILKKDHTLYSNLVLDEKLFHVRCCAHIINLLVRDGLKEIELIVEVVR
ncbi:hypothetical protein LIER_04954 [Lithospermum erythrorhizon]|uniref:BED-type domain-containing protein n=1 Tax=Lithospermum erythrorhizon TaxID=34254 RepID=A0AAV3P2R9_LITER